MINLTIDGKKLEAEEGRTILQTARSSDIDIPTLCYHESLTPIGSCRVCVVEIKTDEISELTTACTHPVEEGLKVITSSEKVVSARKQAVELLLARRPHSKQLQELTQSLNIENPSFILEQRECILCERCVRTCRELVNIEAITLNTQEKDRDVEEATVIHSRSKCIGCGSCAYICPTEAILLENTGSIRKLSTPSGTIKFKLAECKRCGMHWAPIKELKYTIKKWSLEPDLFDFCPDCRELS